MTGGDIIVIVIGGVVIFGIAVVIPCIKYMNNQVPKGYTALDANPPPYSWD